MISDRTVILGFAESLAAIETAWDLMNHGFVVHAFSRSGRAAALAKDPRIVTHKISAPEVKASETVVQLIDLATQLGWPVLMPVDDTAVWLLNTIAQSHPQAKVAGPIGELADAALNK
jgi:hypothetical protein